MYNASCLNGDVEFQLTASAYSAGETFPIIFSHNPNSGPSRRLTIRPATGITATISGNVSNGALVVISGRYIEIDGSNNGSSTQHLTLRNTSVTSPRVILFGSNGLQPVSHCAIRNTLLLNGTTSNSVMALSDSLNIASPGYFSFITISNNKIGGGQYGIYANAVVTPGNGNGLLVSGNNLSLTGTQAIGGIGVFLRGVDGATLQNNIIGNFRGDELNSDKGIQLSDSVRNTLVSGNRIFNLNYTGSGGRGAHGILVATGFANANLTLVNNIIYNLSGDGNGFTDSLAVENPTGILLMNNSASRGQTGIRLYHNTIFLGSDPAFQNTLNKPNAISVCIRMRTSSRAEVVNNILVNQLGRQSALGFGSIGILCNDNSQLPVLNGNAYMVAPSGSGQKVYGYFFSTGQQALSLGQWKSFTLKDAVSVNALPSFSSFSDLHLTPSGNELLSNAGVPLGSSAVMLDFENTQRHPASPDIGADEFLIDDKPRWIGRQSADWFNAENWETNELPNAGRDLTLSQGYPFLPLVGSGQISVRSLLLSGTSGSSILTLDSAVILNCFGSITSEGPKISMPKATLTFSGTAPALLGAGVLANQALGNLINDNENVTGVTLGGPVDVYRSVLFTDNGVRLNTGGHLTLKSTETQTAWVGNLEGKTIQGDVTVERFIPTGIRHPKSWQHLSVPVAGTQTINQAWQDSAVSPNQSRFAGYGTQITSSLGGSVSGAEQLGFDMYTPGGSTMKVYQSATNSWSGVPSTRFTPISNTNGYLVFVRGDRTVTQFNSPANPTVLRAKGRLYTATAGEQPPAVTVPGERFASVGNPYASAIDFQEVNRTTGVDNAFYIWDPLLAGARGLGGFQLISAANGYLPSPGGTLNYSGAEPVTSIESGQAFFVHNSGATDGTVGFSEIAKIQGSQNVFRHTFLPAAAFRFRLFSAPGVSGTLADGVGLILDSTFSNSTDGSDAVKLVNPGENFSIATPSGSLLALETRSGVQAGDTIRFSLTALRRQTYQFRIVAPDLQQRSIQAYWLDRYTQQETALLPGDTNYIDFTVNDQPGSSAADRFLLVFRPVQVLPLRFTNITASWIAQQDVAVRWQVAGEEPGTQYQLQRSEDGRNFRTIAVIQGDGNGQYLRIDNSVKSAVVHYRIIAQTTHTMLRYSEVVTLRQSVNKPYVLLLDAFGPSSYNRTIQLFHFTPGKYTLRVCTALGQRLFEKELNITSSTQFCEIEHAALHSSPYTFLQVINKAGEVISSRIIK